MSDFINKKGNYMKTQEVLETIALNLIFTDTCDLTSRELEIVKLLVKAKMLVITEGYVLLRQPIYRQIPVIIGEI